MSATIYTCEAQFSFYNDTAGRWGPYGKAKNLMELSVTKPDPNTVKDISSKPDTTFGNTRQSRQFSGGSPEITVRTTDLINLNASPAERELFKAALAATSEQYTQAAVSDHHFMGYVDAFDMGIEVGKRNLNTSGAVVHKQASPTTGEATGTASASTATTLVDSSQAWTEDDLVGDAVMITGGTGAGQVVAITDNDATTITVASWTTEPDSTSTYAIVESTALTAGTDYEFSDEDKKYGNCTPKQGGALSLGDVIHGLVDAFEITGTLFRGAAQDSVKFRIKGKAKELESGDEGFLVVHRVSSGSSEAQNFVANAEDPAYKELTLTGEMEIPDGETEPYQFFDGLTYATS